MRVTAGFRRRALEADTLGGYPIAQGDDLFISVWNLHRWVHSGAGARLS